MIRGKSVLTFIPARGGSKTIPQKNIQKIAGKEMLGYTIEAAADSDVSDRIILSTDSQEIAQIGRNYGAETPFMRPPSLATDEARMMDVIKHGMNWVEEQDGSYDVFLYLQPTCPLRKARHILEAFEVFFAKQAYSVVSINETGYIPGRVSTLPSDENMSKFVDQQSIQANRQELATYYELNGAIEMIRWEVMKKNWNWYRERSYPYIIPQPYGLDIDNEIDLKFAQFLIEEGYAE